MRAYFAHLKLFPQGKSWLGFQKVASLIGYFCAIYLAITLSTSPLLRLALIIVAHGVFFTAMFLGNLNTFTKMSLWNVPGTSVPTLTPIIEFCCIIATAWISTHLPDPIMVVAIILTIPLVRELFVRDLSSS